MNELNIYGYISGWFIFDQMDRYAHEHAIWDIWPCVTANASINYFKPVHDLKDTFCQLSDFDKIWNKVQISVSFNKLDQWEPYATASFLFIANKNPS